MDLSRWNRLLESLNVAEEETTYGKLDKAYSEPHRYYHNRQHITDCLTQFDRFAHLAENAAEVECALWFHDAIYRIGSAENEADSGAWARDFLHQSGATGDSCLRVYDFIMATKHDAQALQGDAALVVDIDLSILGREPQVYDLFERNIRREYQQVPEPMFRARRKQILKSFLEREHIYCLGPIRSCFEQAARHNLQTAINALS